MKHLVFLALLYVLVAALMVPTSLFAADDAPAPAEQAAPAPASEPLTAPAPTDTAPAPAPPTTAPAAPAPAAAPTATTTAPAPAPAPAQPEVQKLDDEKPPVAVKAKAAASTGVTIKDFSFGPASVTINVGDTITWTNQGPTAHTATANDGAFDTGLLDAGQSGSHTFDTAGTFAYICTPHPFMKGTVVVQAASTQGGSGDTTGDSGSTAGTGSSASDDGPSLPSTGMDVLALGLLGLLMLGVGVGVRRRSAAESPQPAGRIGW